MNEILPEESFKEAKKKQIPILEKYQFFDLNKHDKMCMCGKYLWFWLTRNKTSLEEKLKLDRMYTCQDRFCPFCTWRRILKYKRLIYSFLEHLHAKKQLRYIFLTLTIPNCSIVDLRATIEHLSKSFKRFSETKRFKGSILGYLRVLEYTIEKKRDGYIHPHFHCLLAVSPKYFKDKRYISQKEYLEMWQKATRDNSIVGVDVRIIKDKSKFKDSEGKLLPYGAVIAELIKYPLKDTDLAKLSNDNFQILTQQLKNIRNINAGGILKGILKKIDRVDDDLIHINENDESILWEKIQELLYSFKNINGKLDYYLVEKGDKKFGS